MAIKCGNCGGYFLADELAMRKPPRHPWRLTAQGEQALAKNQQPGGDHRPCPECGNQTLIGEITRPPRSGVS
jgi:ribosomal protein S27AE